MALASRSPAALLSLIVIACGAPPSSRAMRAEELERAMAYGRILELNDIESAAEKGLLVRIFQVPVQGGDCVPETHRACQHRLFVSVATFDEQPQTNVFDLGLRGEVVGVRWLPVDATDSASLALSMSRLETAPGSSEAGMDVQVEHVRVNATPTQLIEHAETR